MPALVETTLASPAEFLAPEPSTPPAPKAKIRLTSLDAFRGATIALMLLVNNAAMDDATPTTLVHAPWGGGVTLADLVFPWFLLCAGVSIPFSFASAKAKGGSAWGRAGRLVWRAVALVLLGFALESAVQHKPTFGLGVLGLIGLASLVAGALAGLPAALRGAIAIATLTGYGWALLHLPHSGGGPGFEESRNLVRYLNYGVLQPYGLTGLPSVIPTAALVLIGTLVGDALRSPWSPLRKSLTLLFGAGWLVAAGVIANVALPYNKPVWTPAYIYLAAGLGTAILSLLYLVVDVKGWRAWTVPLLVFGSNAILAYAGPILVKSLTLQLIRTPSGLNAQDAMLHALKVSYGPVNGGWIWTLGYLAIVWIVLLVLYRRRLFLRL